MIILINGTINSGKSTISKLLAKEIPNSVVIEVDDLDRDKQDVPIDDRIQLRLERAIEAINKAVREGRSCIVPNPISQEDYNFMLDGLRALNQSIHVFTLNPGLETASKNRGNRELDDWERERIKHHHKIGIHNPDFGVIIDNSKQAPTQTTQEILKQLGVK